MNEKLKRALAKVHQLVAEGWSYDEACFAVAKRFKVNLDRLVNAYRNAEDLPLPTA